MNTYIHTHTHQQTSTTPTHTNSVHKHTHQTRGQVSEYTHTARKGQTNLEVAAGLDALIPVPVVARCPWSPSPSPSETTSPTEKDARRVGATEGTSGYLCVCVCVCNTGDRRARGNEREAGRKGHGGYGHNPFTHIRTYPLSPHTNAPRSLAHAHNLRALSCRPHGNATSVSQPFLSSPLPSSATPLSPNRPGSSSFTYHFPVPG